MMDVPICYNSHSAALVGDCANIAAGKDPKPLAGATNKNSSRPGTAKARPGATMRPGASSAGLTAMAASEGVCLQISNKKDERARKVRQHKLCQVYAQPTTLRTMPHQIPSARFKLLSR